MIFFKKYRIGRLVIDFFIENLMKYQSEEHELVFFHFDVFVQPLCVSISFVFLNINICFNYFRAIKSEINGTKI